MTPRARRHLFLLALAILVLLGVLHLQGCATDYTWTREHPAAESRKWITVTRAELFKVCGTNPARSPSLGGCAFWSPRICTIYSDRTEGQAEREMSGDGMTLAEHEREHCDGKVHGKQRRE